MLVNEQHRISEEHINTCILRVMHALFKRQETFKNPPLVNPEQGYQIFANQGLARVLGAAGKAAGAEFCQEKINYGIQLPNSHHSFVHNFSPRSRALDIRLSTSTHPHFRHLDQQFPGFIKPSLTNSIVILF